MSMFKFFLGRILGSYVEQPGVDQMESGPLLLYQQQFRGLVGQVLMQDMSLGPPAPYIPLFYQIGLSSSTKKFAEVHSHCCFLYVSSSYPLTPPLAPPISSPSPSPSPNSAPSTPLA